MNTLDRSTAAFPRWLRISLLALTAVRLAVAARAPLSADEAYYWTWSKALAAGYLDHPPMVAVWIRIGTAVAGDTALGVRLLGPVSALIGTLLLMRAAADFWPGRSSSELGAGVVAACLLNATLALNVGAVVMTPDTPLLFFWTGALAAFGRLIRTRRPGWWLAIGVCGGLAMDSKYSAALLAASAVVWLVAMPAARGFLRCWQLYAGVALAAACFAPVLAWNAAHGFASFAKQGGRTDVWQPASALGYLAELLGGQIGLATPWVALLFGGGLGFVARGFWRREAGPGFLACVTLVPAAVFLEHALGDRVQANWPAIVFPGAALAASGIPAIRFWRPAACLGLVLAGLVFLQAAAAPLALPRWADFTVIRLAGWADLAGQVFVAQSRAHADFVAADEYGLASELAFRLHGQVIGISPRWDFFALPKANLAGRSGILVRSDRAYGAPDARLWSAVEPLGQAVRARGGVTAETYHLYRVTGRPLAIGTRLP